MAAEPSAVSAVTTAMKQVREGLDAAVKALESILADPKITVVEGIAANDMLKSLKRFRAKV